jgi:hypothetical protein
LRVGTVDRRLAVLIASKSPIGGGQICIPRECPSQKIVRDCEITPVGAESKSIAAGLFLNRKMLVRRFHSFAIKCRSAAIPDVNIRIVKSDHGSFSACSSASA